MQGLLRDAIAVIALTNLVVSIVIAVNAGYTKRQKLAQIILVWLVPALGSIVFGVFLWTQRGNAPRSRESSDAPSRAGALSAAATSINQQRG